MSFEPPIACPIWMCFRRLSLECFQARGKVTKVSKETAIRVVLTVATLLSSILFVASSCEAIKQLSLVGVSMLFFDCTGSGCADALHDLDRQGDLAGSSLGITCLAFIIFIISAVALSRMSNPKSSEAHSESSDRGGKSPKIERLPNQTATVNIAKEFHTAREYVRHKRYEDAYSVLATIDHPKAREWERKLERIAPRKRFV